MKAQMLVCKVKKTLADLKFTSQAVWPEKNRQMSIKVAQKWFH